MSRRSRQDWLRAGLAELGEGGPAGVTIDALCRHLACSKGSFYHHFASARSWRRTLLAFAETDIAARDGHLQAACVALADGLRRFVEAIATDEDLLNRVVSQIRGWAQSDADAQAVQARIDMRRRQILASLCQADDTSVPDRAEQLYMLLLGIEQVRPALTLAKRQAAIDTCLAWLALGKVRPESTGAAGRSRTVTIS